MRNTKITGEILVCATALFAAVPNANGVASNKYDDTKTIIYSYDAAGNRISRGGEVNKIKQKKRITGNGKDIASITQTGGDNDHYVIELNPSVRPTDCTVSIYDLSGKFFGSTDFTGNRAEINISGLHPGCYIVKVETSNTTCSFKIVK